MVRALGIDLGTTFSAVAVVGEDGRPTVLRNREGENITPSVVLLQGDQALVGSMAARTAATMPDDCVRFVKRFMGNPNWRFVDSRDTEYRAEEISALVLRRLADDAEMMLGRRVDDVVITVPAYFDDARRTATLDAAVIAGLRPLRLINEPTAAAVAYGLDEAERATLLVYDLGGGTFDVTLMTVADGTFEVLGTDGDRALGGFDFDNALMTIVNREVQAAGGPDLFDGDVTEADLREKCELAKRTLTNVPRAAVVVSGGGRHHRVEVTREAFEGATQPLLDRTEALVDGVLETAGKAWTDVDHVLLVGGSTRMPMVRDMVERLSGRPPRDALHPDEVVAYGAAVVADLTAAEHEAHPEGGTQPEPAARPATGPGGEAGTDGGGRPIPAGTAAAGTPAAGRPRLSISDVTSQGIGVLAYDVDRRAQHNVPVIPRNSPIPCRHESTFATLEDGQTEWRMELTEGDDPDPDYVVRLLERPLRLPPGLPAGTELTVRMAYDGDGVVHVDVIDADGRSLGEVELDRPLNLDRPDVERMRAAIARLDVR